MRNLKSLLLALFTAISLTGCGGGSDNGVVVFADNVSGVWTGFTRNGRLNAFTTIVLQQPAYVRARRSVVTGEISIFGETSTLTGEKDDNLVILNVHSLHGSASVFYNLTLTSKNSMTGSIGSNGVLDSGVSTFTRP